MKFHKLGDTYDKTKVIKELDKGSFLKSKCGEYAIIKLCALTKEEFKNTFAWLMRLKIK